MDLVPDLNANTERLDLELLEVLKLESHEDGTADVIVHECLGHGVIYTGIEH